MSLDHSIHFHRPEAVRADEWMLVGAAVTQLHVFRSPFPFKICGTPRVGSFGNDC